jgi:hypothetical protein
MEAFVVSKNVGNIKNNSPKRLNRKFGRTRTGDFA